MVGIDVHPSIEGRTLEDVVAASLRANRLDPKLLYVTPQQAALWREVFLKHSPVHSNPEFSRIYREAYAKAVEHLPPGKIRLIGLGSGTGLKEAELAAKLLAQGHDVWFSAIDVSRELVEEAARSVSNVGAHAGRHLVCDLAELDFLKRWLDDSGQEEPRLFTLFGLVPNLETPFVMRLLGELLRPGDLLLVSVHLAPVGESLDLETAMKRILPQYDNAETKAWLRAAIDHWRLGDLLGEIAIGTGRAGNVPCIVGSAPWKSSANEALQVFQSLRYTPVLFDELLQLADVRGERLAITACREEAIWLVGSGA